MKCLFYSCSVIDSSVLVRRFISRKNRTLRIYCGLFPHQRKRICDVLVVYEVRVRVTLFFFFCKSTSDIINIIISLVNLSLFITNNYRLLKHNNIYLPMYFVYAIRHFILRYIVIPLFKFYPPLFFYKQSTFKRFHIV